MRLDTERMDANDLDAFRQRVSFEPYEVDNIADYIERLQRYKPSDDSGDGFDIDELKADIIRLHGLIGEGKLYLLDRKGAKEASELIDKIKDAI